MTGYLAPAMFLLAVAAWAALPFLPALIELYRRTDVDPLDVTQDYAGDTTIFARNFRKYIVDQLARPAPPSAGERRALLPDGTPVHIVTAESPYGADEPDRRRSERQPRVVVGLAPLHIPAAATVRGEVYAKEGLTGGAGAAFRALYSEGSVDLAAESVVLRWAHAEHQLHAHGGSQLYGRTTAGAEIRLEEGCRFERMEAPRIVFAGAAEQAAADPPTLSGDEPRQVVAPRRARGDLRLPPYALVEGDMVVVGTLDIGEKSIVRGSIKARFVTVGQGSQVTAGIIAEEDLYVGPRCSVGGPIVADRDAFIDTACTIGAVDAPTTITAASIYVSPGVVSHGAVWARQLGLVTRLEV